MIHAVTEVFSGSVRVFDGPNVTFVRPGVGLHCTASSSKDQCLDLEKTYVVSPEHHRAMPLHPILKVGGYT